MSKVTLHCGSDGDWQLTREPDAEGTKQALQFLSPLVNLSIAARRSVARLEASCSLMSGRMRARMNVNMTPSRERREREPIREDIRHEDEEKVIPPEQLVRIQYEKSGNCSDHRAETWLKSQSCTHSRLVGSSLRATCNRHTAFEGATVSVPSESE